MATRPTPLVSKPVTAGSIPARTAHFLLFKPFPGYVITYDGSGTKVLTKYDLIRVTITFNSFHEIIKAKRKFEINHRR